MATTPKTAERGVILVETAPTRPMMGIEVLEPVPARKVPYELSDPYILVHEATVPIHPERAKLDTTHPRRGFDNLWYIISGVASTGHSFCSTPMHPEPPMLINIELYCAHLISRVRELMGGAAGAAPHAAPMSIGELP